MKTLAVDAMLGLILPLFLLWHGLLFQAERIYQRAEREFAGKNYEQALPLYQQAAALWPARAMYQRAVARTCLKLQRPSQRDPRLAYQAWKALRQLQRTEQVYPYDWFDLGTALEILHSAGIRGLPDPENYYRRAWEIDPTNPRFLAGWVSWLVRKGRLEEARPLVLRLMAAEPKAIHLFGDRLLPDLRAREEFGREIADLPSAQLEYARYLYKRKETDLAGRIAAQIPASAWSQAAIAIPLSELFFRLNQPEPANQVLDRALTANPRNLAVVHSRAQSLARQKNFGAAVQVYQQALRDNPSDWELNLHLARMARLAGEDELAMTHYRRALAGRPNVMQEKEIHLGLAELNYQQGKLRSALAEYEKALELAPADSKLADKVKRLQVEVEQKRPAE